MIFKEILGGWSILHRYYIYLYGCSWWVIQSELMSRILLVMVLLDGIGGDLITWDQVGITGEGLYVCI